MSVAHRQSALLFELQCGVLYSCLTRNLTYALKILTDLGYFWVTILYISSERVWDKCIWVKACTSGSQMKQFVPTWSSRLHKLCRDGLTSDKEANVVFLLQSSLQKPLMSRRVSLWACKASFKFVCKVFTSLNGSWLSGGCCVLKLQRLKTDWVLPETQQCWPDPLLPPHSGHFHWLDYAHAV